MGAVAALAVLVGVALAFGWMNGRSTGVPSSEASPSATALPAATPLTAARLLIQAVNRATCHSIGGCSGLVELRAANTWWRAEFDSPRDHVLVASKDLPVALPEGDYQVTLTYYDRSDAIMAGDYWSRFVELRAKCTGSFTVVPGQVTVTVNGNFSNDSCTVEVRTDTAA